jgi:hypothetical protein
MSERFGDIIKQRLEDERIFHVDPQHREDFIRILDKSGKRRRILPFWWISGGIVLIIGAAIWTATSLPWKDQSTLSPQMNKVKTGIPVATGQSSPLNNVEEVGMDQHPVQEQVIEESTWERAASTRTSRTTDSGLRLTSENSISISAKTSAQSNPNFTVLQKPKDIIPANPEAAVEIAISPTRELTALPVAIDAPLQFNLLTEASSGSVVEDPLTHASAIKPVRRSNWSVSAIAGAGPVFSTSAGTGWKARTGVGLGYNLSASWKLLASAGYQVQDGGFSFDRSSNVQHAGFGTRSSFNTLTPERLHFIYTQLGVQFRMRRHALIALAGPQFLYGAQGRVEINSYSAFASETRDEIVDGWVKTDGIHQIQWMGHLAYGYQLSPKLMVQAGADVRLSPFLAEDPALQAEGYQWQGKLPGLQPFITFNYVLYGKG